jgi:peptidylglycine monooxygenase
MHAAGKEDYSGVKIRFTDEPQPKQAATLLIVTNGEVEAGKTDTFEAACTIPDDVVLHPFAYRVHTHRHGTDVSGWLVKG